MKRYNIHEPTVLKKHLDIVNKILKKNHISTFGEYSEKCSKLIQKITGTQYVSVTNSGSSALLSSFKAIGIKKNDLIITTNYTFIATLNMINLSQCDPWIFDTEKTSPIIDIDSVEKTLERDTYRKGKHVYRKIDNRRIYCICPVYVNGLIINYKKIFKLAKKFNLKIINDCAGSFLTIKNFKDLSKYSDISISSFNGNKCPSSGMGGCTITKSKKYGKFISNFIQNFTTKTKYLHNSFGFNCKISNIHASILFCELKNIKNLEKRKNQIYNFYLKELNKNSQFYFFEKKNNKEIIWINQLIVKDTSLAKKMMNYLKKNNIFTENFWIPMSKQNFLIKNYNLNFNKFSNSNSYYSKVVPLPSSLFLNKEDLKYICNVLNSF